MLAHIRYYFWASFRRKLLDKLQEKYRSIYHGVVLDIGGRDRGKFKKPKNEVGKWIFADISPEHKPDLVLDIADMHVLENDSIDVIAAMEVFMYVENIRKALDECSRILKKEGRLVFSTPFLFPIADDPVDLTRWTEAHWKSELIHHGFTVETCELMGGFFTVMADFVRTANNSMPSFIRHIGFLFYPFLSLLVTLDKTSFIQNNKTLRRCTSGYFIIAKK